jgi:hypothetical protein
MAKILKVSMILLLLMSGFLLKAQQIGDLDSERGRQSITAVTVPTGIFQVESGFQYDGDRELGVKTSHLRINTTRLRLGLSDHLEMRLEAGYLKLSHNGESVQGLTPMKLGLKSQVSASNGKSPDVSILMMLVPARVGSDHFSQSNWGLDLVGAFGWHLPKQFDLGANIGLLVNDGDQDSLVIPLSLALGFPFNFSWDGFIGLQGAYIQGSEARLSAGFGVTYKVNNDLVLDAYLGKGINDGAIDWNFGVGLSWRIGPFFR